MKRVCLLESKKGRMPPAVNYWKTALSILAALSASLALAEDFKTINGKEYKNVSVSRVEPDGIVLKSKSGIAKVYFTAAQKFLSGIWELMQWIDFLDLPGVEHVRASRDNLRKTPGH